MLERQKNKKIFGIKITSIAEALALLLVFSIPFTHKELFSFYDNDLVISKFILVIVSILGFIFVLKKYKSYIYDPLFILLGSFIVFQVISVFFSLDKINSIRFIVFQFAVFLSYPVFREYISDKGGKIDKVFYTYFASFSFVIVFLCLQLFLLNFLNFEIGGVWPSFGVPTRYGSSFWDVNHFGIYISSFLLFSTGFYLSKVKDKRFSNRFIYLAYLGILIVSFTALFLTRSRSSFIGLFFGVLVFASLSSGLYRRFGNFLRSKVFVYLFGVLIVIIPIILLVLFADLIREALFFRAYSTYAHLFLIKTGVNLWIDQPFFGIGANSFHASLLASEYRDIFYFIDPADVNLKLPLHSLWLEVLTETGIFSFVSFVLYWLLMIVLLFRQFSKNKDFIALGLLSGIVAFLVGGIMYSYKAEYFWVYVIISSAYVYYHSLSNIVLPKKVSINTIKAYIIDIFKVCGIKRITSLDISRLLLFSVSVILLVLPVAFITSPLSYSEISAFYTQYDSNIVIQVYPILLNLFRYIFGNYMYTGRLLSLVFYVSSVVLMWNIFRRYTDNVISLCITALMIGLSSLLMPMIEVSIRPYLLFILLVAMGAAVLIMSRIKPVVCVMTTGLKTNYLFSILVISLIVGIAWNSNRLITNNYSKELLVLSEIAYNKRALDTTDSTIWIDSDIDPLLIYYFCDEADINVDLLYTKKCRLNKLSYYGDNVDYTKRNVIIPGLSFLARPIVATLEEMTDTVNTNRLQIGLNYIIIHDGVKTNVN